MSKYADYVINRYVGEDSWDPTDTAFTEEEAREKARKLSIHGPITEVVYSPVEDLYTDVLIARYSGGKEIGKGKRMK